MLTAFEFINVEQLHKKNPALLSFHLSSATSDHILNRIDIIYEVVLSIGLKEKTPQLRGFCWVSQCSLHRE